ncbi:AmmeMemoRadiSam system protein B [Shewanella yunxiaonensis]|uniref:MEMO1 family protein KDN34_12210 n=1 Tax=Shewanella yunxiaonensis TaxID=2829809 RepID=A0ABX7YR39_9GAMM|nr:AmmeMemoRadiSam system protein B [Shewanella yunxiaonensis]QUN04988.1 AmmeMemoRadiSam system protein B [Shewanella yunxiaonensis]
MMNIRLPAVAGHFYQRDPVQLRSQIQRWLHNELHESKSIKAILVPHAGYIYSGTTAALAYSLINRQKSRFNKVILVGPSHHYYFDGCALPVCEQFGTPLGQIVICQEHRQQLQHVPLVIFSDEVHQNEHCLEVQLPFLQSCLNRFQLTPIVTSNISAEALATVIAPLWQEDTLLVISSDLSHYHSYAEANEIDQHTCDKIEHFQASISPEEACGATGVNALLILAARHHYQLRLLQRINSGDSAGDKSRVVGYASYIVTDI